MRISVLTIG